MKRVEVVIFIGYADRDWIVIFNDQIKLLLLENILQLSSNFDISKENLSDKKCIAFMNLCTMYFRVVDSVG